MLRTLVKPSSPSCAAYLPDLAPAVLQVCSRRSLAGHSGLHQSDQSSVAIGGLDKVMHADRVAAQLFRSAAMMHACIKVMSNKQSFLRSSGKRAPVGDDGISLMLVLLLLERGLRHRALDHGHLHRCRRPTLETRLLTEACGSSLDQQGPMAQTQADVAYRLLLVGADVDQDQRLRLVQQHLDLRSRDVGDLHMVDDGLDMSSTPGQRPETSVEHKTTQKVHAVCCWLTT